MPAKHNFYGRVTLACEWCGKPFEVRLSKSASARFHSRACQRAYWSDAARRGLRSRFDAKWVGLESGCRQWTGALDKDGYGRFWMNDGRRSAAAHVVAWELAFGAVPKGLELDHVCRNRACVNPTHLEPVTGPENTRRGVHRDPRPWRSLWCNRGHYRTTALTHFLPNGKTRCRLCERYDQRLQREKKRGGTC